MENQERFTIMVVNDDVASCFLTTSQLEKSNLFKPPLVFNKADEALRYIQKNCLESIPTQRLPLPEILLIDINMPFKDGFDFVDDLPKIFPDLKQRTTLCFLTFSNHPSDKWKANEVGADCYFLQPLNDWDCRHMTQVATAKKYGLMHSSA